MNLEWIDFDLLPPSVMANRIRQLMKTTVTNLIDALPPYRRSEGPLENKETDPDGRFVITVGLAKIEVDRITFETLAIGEYLRVRYTRGRKAVNIDRLLPGRGPG